MKANFLTAALGIFLISAPLVSSAQKKNVTDAAMKMKKYNPISMPDSESKKIVEEAKKYIDSAAINAKTAEDMKMHLYRAEVYYALIELAKIDALKGQQINKKLIEEYAIISKSSFKKVIEDSEKLFKKDAEDFINPRSAMVYEMGIKSYNEKKFEFATVFFLEAYGIQQFIGIENNDAYKNTTLCLKYAVDSLLKVKNFEDASILTLSVYENMPKNIDVIINLINIKLQKGDIVGVEKYLNEALILDPRNKQLYYALGTSYLNLKKYEKAEENLIKAIELDSNFIDAHSNLAALYIDWNLKLADESKNLDYKNPRVIELDNKKKEILSKSIPSLEKIISAYPDNKSVMLNLAVAYRSNGNEEKSKFWYDKSKQK